MSGFRAAYLIAAVTGLLLLGTVLGGDAGEVTFVAAVVMMPAALLLLVTRQGRPVVGARVAAWGTILVLGSGFGLLLAWRYESPTIFWGFGLPAPLAVQILIALVPLIALGVLFARLFDGFRPSDETLETIRSLSDADS